MSFTRRKFIKDFTIAAGGAVLDFTLDTHPFNRDTKHVIILGAGLSGMTAAYSLIQRGYTCEIFEARNRLGGRVFSHMMDREDNLVIELGAEWIGESHQRILALCEEFGLKVLDNRFEVDLLYGGEYSQAQDWDYSEQANEIFDFMYKGYSTWNTETLKMLDQIDWWRFLVNHGISGKDLKIRELLDSTDFGESIRQVSAYVAISEYSDSSETHELDFKIEGGNHQLVKALAERIGSQHIHLGVPVTAVEQDSKGVRIFTSEGKTAVGDYLICTIPTYSILKMKWKPGLSNDRIAAFNQLQYGRINKYAMLYSERFWKKENFSLISDLPGHYYYHGTKNQRSEKGVLISYSIGEKAAVFGSCTPEQRFTLASLSLESRFGDVRPMLKNAVNYYWGTDAYSFGAYALYGPDQWFRWSPLLRQPENRIFFAGEYVAEWTGFMEGAVESGQQAASMIMQ
ncbi:MAG TPA: NAD(P)/FAD-dependent oxidoreductase [Saprospiraceae bacterium]|nr:NAD(P)/FAD-dependent oxidoreductase [Saprospiraceae bacterium]